MTLFITNFVFTHILSIIMILRTCEISTSTFIRYSYLQKFVRNLKILTSQFLTHRFLSCLNSRIVNNNYFLIIILLLVVLDLTSTLVDSCENIYVKYV
jgi:magnesium-transporting ATPase (P-type)